MRQPPDHLEIEQDLAFQRREWRLQRVGQSLLILFVGAALLGVFGGGPVSGATARAPNGLAVEYERFLRHRAPTRLRVHLAASRSRDGVALRLTRDYFDGLRLVRIVPEPIAIDIGHADVALRFDAPGLRSPLTVVVDAEPIRTGWRRAELRQGDDAPARFGQLVYF